MPYPFHFFCLYWSINNLVSFGLFWLTFENACTIQHKIQLIWLNQFGLHPMASKKRGEAEEKMEQKTYNSLICHENANFIYTQDGKNYMYTYSVLFSVSNGFFGALVTIRCSQLVSHFSFVLVRSLTLFRSLARSFSCLLRGGAFMHTETHFLYSTENECLQCTFHFSTLLHILLDNFQALSLISKKRTTTTTKSNPK